MSTKFLIDCVWTAEAAKCSTVVIFKTAVERLLAERPDTFFYWLVPEWATPEDMAFLPDSDRVVYFATKQSKDRTREYLTLPEELYEAVTFYGPCWDFDVLLTMRAGLVPQMRLLMNGPRNIRLWWTKEVWLIDVMPVLSFKETVSQMVPELHDRWTLEGYLAADRVWNVSYYEPKKALQVARKHLTPSQVLNISGKIGTAVTAQFDDFRLKAPKHRYNTTAAKRPFGLSFIGRMEKANGIEDIAAMLEKAWILRGDNVKQIVCTVSKVVKSFDEELVDVRFPPREEFWKIVETEMDAFVALERSGAISLSMLEPLMLGTPCITTRTEAKEGLLGKDYPFFAEGPAQVYPLFKLLYDDYGAQYQRFADWHTGWFEPTWRKRFDEDLIYPRLVQAVDAYEQKMRDRTSDIAALEVNQTVLDLKACHQPGETIYDTLIREGSKKFGVLAQKADPEDQKARNLTFMSSFNVYRLGMKWHHGFVDASATLGHLEPGA